MSRRWSLFPTLALLVALSSPAHATTVVVPDNYPTIQAAIDGGADVIQVRDGLAPERLTVTRYVEIQPGPAPQYHSTWRPMPLIQSLELAPGVNQIDVQGVRFLGEVDLGHLSSGGITFEGCRFDSSFSDPGNHGAPFVQFSIRGCMILGPVSVTGYVQFASNTVIGGKVSIWADGNHDIRNNYIQGPAEVGLDLSLGLSIGSVSMNTIRGTNTGIVSEDGWTNPFRNDIADCSGDGILFLPSHYIDACDSNRIVRCGGAGIVVLAEPEHLRSNMRISGNFIEVTGHGGISVDPRVPAYEIDDNVVLDAGGDGITVGIAHDLQHNVVGRSNGAGIHLIGGEYRPPYRVFANTVFSSGAEGFRVSGDTYSDDSLFNNISALNAGPGLSVELTGAPNTAPPQLGCNNWYQNAGGAVVGMSPSATDLQLNPLFCDLPAADVHLASNSPLLSAAGCGLIGALGQGCVATAAVQEPSAMPITRFRAWPVPAAGAVSFEMPPSSGATSVEVFDVAGARRWQGDIAAGATRFEWDRRDSNGRSAAPGVYFARLRRAGVEVATTRIVLAE